MADVLQFINGISARRVIDYLKSNGFDSSLAQLRIKERGDRHKYSLYEHHPNALRITGEDALRQKVNYIHMNPVRAGLVENPDDYLYSSSRQWNGRPIENEPLVVDLESIKWRAAWEGGKPRGEKKRSRKSVAVPQIERRSRRQAQSQVPSPETRVLISCVAL